MVFKLDYTGPCSKSSLLRLLCSHLVGAVAFHLRLNGQQDYHHVALRFLPCRDLDAAVPTQLRLDWRAQCKDAVPPPGSIQRFFKRRTEGGESGADSSAGGASSTEPGSCAASPTTQAAAAAAAAGGAQKRQRQGGGGAGNKSGGGGILRFLQRSNTA